MDLVNPIKLIVLAAFCYGWSRLDRSFKYNAILLAILSVALVTEIVNSVHALLGSSNSLTITISVIIHHFLWMSVFLQFAVFKKLAGFSIALFVAFAIVDLVFLEGHERFNFYTFVVGSLLYIVLFIIETWNHFRAENLAHFESPGFLLISSPLIFMCGITMLFGFRSLDLIRLKVFGDVQLYDAVIYIVNIVYYMLIGLYIRKNSRLVYAK